MKKSFQDPHQLTLDDFFQIPCPVNPQPASMDHAIELRHLLSADMKKTSKTRFEIASRMSELTGHEISKAMLDAWSAESRESWRFPLEYATAFEIACDSYSLTEFMARKRGCRVYAGDEVRQAEIGRIESQMDELASKLKTLKKARIAG